MLKLKKMKKYFSIIACGALLLSGCAKETLVAPDDSRAVFTVGIQDESKTTMGELSQGKRSIYWSNGDVLNINGFESEPLAEVAENQNTAQFVFSPAPDAPYSMTYPASIYGGEGKVVLSDNPTVMPLYGLAQDNLHMNLSVLTGAAKITITLGNDNDKISYVEISAPGKQLTGEFDINYSTGALTGTAVTDQNSKLKRYVRRAVTADAPVEVFLPMPAGTYSALTVKVVDESGHYLTVNTTGAKTFEAGQIKAFPAIVFNPTGTLVDVEIPTAAKWNEFATAYNEGTAEDCFISITGDLDFAGTDVVTIGSYKAEKYFSGKINGNNHVVKNLHSSKALIGSIGSYGMVKDLTIDESCSYTVTYGPENPENGYFGPFAYYLKGELINCVNKAPITLDVYHDLENDIDIFIGGLLGRIKDGIADGCSNYGTITLNSAYKSSANAYAGGITSYMSNPNGTVQNCANYGELVNHSCWAKQAFLGGICGTCHATIKDSKNEGNITSDGSDRPAGDACKHIFMGGISAIQYDGSLTGCTNSGNFTTASAVKLQYIGGIAGSIDGTITPLANNTSSGNILSTGNVRVPFYGGLYGRVTSANNFEFSGNPFTGSIALDTYESSDANTYIYVGGLIAMSRDDITIKGVGEPVVVDNKITVKATGQKSYRLAIGGIIGAAGEEWAKDTAAVVNSTVVLAPKTTGTKVEISNVSTSGYITLTGGSGIKPLNRVATFGGIIGGAFSGGTIENCNSSADINFGEELTSGEKSGSNGYPSHIGGILGQADFGNLVIKNCSASGNVYNRLYNNNPYNIDTHRGSCATGGILGSFGYFGWLTSDESVCTIENCHFTDIIYAYRGCAGGIAGYVRNTAIKDCSFIGSRVGRGSPAGGVAGAAESSSAEGCTVKVSHADGIKGVSGGSTKGDAGGIFGVANGCSIDGCRFFGNVSGNDDCFKGGLLGNNDDKCTIGTKAKCTFGGKVGEIEVDDMFYIMCYCGKPDLIDVDIVEHIGYWDGTL